MTNQHQPDETRIDESQRQRFEEAWLRESPLPLAECLPEVATPEFLPTLEELVHIQLEFAWKAHAASNADRPALIEDLLEQFPDLGQREILIRLLKQEYACRLAAGDQPTPAEYSERFPALVVTGREILPVADQTVGEAPQDATDAGTTTNEPTENTALMDQPTILPTGSVAPGTGEETLAMPAGQAAGPSIRMPGIGDTIAGFCMEKELGRGGMGIVYEAAHTQTGRRVAVKVLSPELAGNTETMERFMREAQLAAALSHARSTFVFEAGEEQGCPFIVMELMPGRTLKDLADDEGPMPVNRAVDLIFDIIDGLAAAHSAGVIHRDVKPSNCFLDTDGRLKVGDYGLSKSLIVESDLTQSGSFLGTPLYSAPEQVRGTDVDERTDLYAVGATLFTLIAGRAPFIGESASVIAQIVSDEAPLLSSLAEDAPADLDHVIARTLEKDPDKRFSSLEELGAALRPFATGGTTVASVGRRLAAFMFDYMLINLFIGILGGIYGAMFGQQFAETIEAVAAGGTNWFVIGMSVFSGCLMFFYFFLQEGMSGQTLGKRLMRLRIVGNDGGRVGWKTTFLRLLVFMGVYEIAGAVLTWAALPYYGSSIHMLMDAAKYLVWGGMALSMRPANGFRGLHELASGSRVVSLVDDRLAQWATVPIVAAHLDEQLPATLGPYQVTGGLGFSGTSQVLLGRDETLDRSVWLFCRDDANRVPSTTRTELTRTTRPRWLQSGATGDTHWDAYEAVTGSPIRMALQRKHSAGWDRGRHVLGELADELHAATSDQTLHDRLQIDQVWIGRDGMLKILDQRLSSQPDPGSNPDESTQFYHVGILQHLTAAYTDKQVLPGHARRFVEELNSRPEADGTLEWASGQLAGMQEGTLEISWRDRVGMLGVAMAVDGIPLLLLMHVAIIILKTKYTTLEEQLGGIWWALVPVAVAALIVGGITRGGFALRVINVELQRTDGASASWRLGAQRHFATWVPFVAYALAMLMLGGIGQAMMTPGITEARQAELAALMFQNVGGLVVILFTMFLGPMLICGAILWSVLNPRRGPVDLMSGTQLVPH